MLVIAPQLAPIGPSARATLSPHQSSVDRALWLDAPEPLAERPRPLSIDPAATRVALALGLAFVLVFWSARGIFARGGIRVATRGIAWTGLGLAAIAIVQHATAPRFVYWMWPTIFGAAFGPYRNRNDFATWLIMAIPLTSGYILARIESHGRGGQGSRLHVGSVVDSTAVWLVGAALFMSAALLTSLSRSGLTGAAAALAGFFWLSRSRIGRGGRVWLIVGAASVIVVAAAYANLDALMNRMGETLEAGIGGRRVIWKDTWAMIQDFWATGIGLGAYERGMLVYQRSRGLFYFNHAHNEYLQLAAEGGIVLCIPLGLALVVGARDIARRLRAETTPVFWIRAGATSGLIAVAVQNVWDTGLRMPANAVLLAVLAAIAVHDRAGPMVETDVRETSMLGE